MVRRTAHEAVGGCSVSPDTDRVYTAYVHSNHGALYLVDAIITQGPGRYRICGVNQWRGSFYLGGSRDGSPQWGLMKQHRGNMIHFRREHDDKNKNAIP